MLRYQRNWLLSRVERGADGKWHIRAGHEPERAAIARATKQLIAAGVALTLEYLPRTAALDPTNDQSYLCDNCGKRFNGESAFTKHRIGAFELHEEDGTFVEADTRRCRTDDELLAAGMAYNVETARWVTPYTSS